jgi:SNF2 family DNA or RNA helicase
LRCCSEGLNITEANRVIIVDPWWNRTKEKQAYGRVKRIGQKKSTHCVRILSSGDQEVVRLQARKSKEIDYAMGDDGHKVRHLKGRDLDDLFAKQESPDDEDEMDEDADMGEAMDEA